MVTTSGFPHSTCSPAAGSEPSVTMLHRSGRIAMVPDPLPACRATGEPPADLGSPVRHGLAWQITSALCRPARNAQCLTGGSPTSFPGGA